MNLSPPGIEPVAAGPLTGGARSGPGHVEEGSTIIAERPAPAGVVDRLLWQDAQQMLEQHAGPDADDDCVGCGRHWPCAPRRVAERADAASRRPWREAWTLRHDLNSIRPRPGAEDRGRRARRGPNERPPAAAGGNRGYFE